MGVTPRRIVIRVDELVVTGFPAGQGHRIAVALERELVRLLGEGNAPDALTRSGALASVPARPVRAPAGATPESVGESAAGSIHGALGR